MLANPSIKSRLIVVIGLLAVVLVGIGVFGVYSLSVTDASLKTVYEDRTVALGYLDAVARSNVRAQRHIGLAAAASPDMARREIAVVNDALENANRSWDAYMTTYLTPEEKMLAKRFEAARGRFLTEGIQPSLDAMARHDIATGAHLSRDVLPALAVEWDGAIEALIGLQLDVAAQEYQLSARIDQRARVISLSTIVFGVTAAILVGWWLIGSVTRSLEEAVRVAGRIARGDLTQRVHPRSSREAAHLLRSLREMNGHLADIVSTVRESTQMVTCATSTVSTGRLDQSTCAKPHATSLEPRAAHAVRGRGWLGPDLG